MANQQLGNIETELQLKQMFDAHSSCNLGG